MLGDRSWPVSDPKLPQAVGSGVTAMERSADGGVDNDPAKTAPATHDLANADECSSRALAFEWAC